MPGGLYASIEAPGEPREDTGHGVDVDGGVGHAVQEELLVDDVLACDEKGSRYCT